MEVTKRREPSSRIWIGQCLHCLSEMRAEQWELYVQVSGDNGNYYHYAYYDCPVCFEKEGVVFRPQSQLEHGGER